MQYEEGSYSGRQGSANNSPVFWVWRPSGSTTEYWVFYKYGQSGGFDPPGIGNPSVEWHMKHETGGTYTTGCEFLSWVADENGHAESELEVHEHKISILDCSS